MADLSRGVVGVIGRTLVVNVPGSPAAAVESLAALEPTLGHALETLAGPFDHEAAGPSGGSRPDLAEADMGGWDAIGAAAAGAVSNLPPILPGLTPLAPPAPGDPNDPWRDMPSSPREAGDVDVAREPEPPG
jgi:hypothetical protein